MDILRKYVRFVGMIEILFQGNSVKYFLKGSLKNSHGN